MVRRTGVSLIWMNLRCEEAILDSLLTRPKLYDGAKTKVTYIGILQRLLREHHLLEPPHGTNRNSNDISQGLGRERASRTLRQPLHGHGPRFYLRW